MSTRDSRREQAWVLMEELRALLDRHGLSKPEGVSSSRMEALTEDLVRPLPPIYYEYLLAFGEKFELMEIFGYRLTLDEADLFQDFDGRQYANIGTYRDNETGEESFVGYDLDSPTLDNLDCRIVEIDVDSTVHETCHGSLLGLVRQCVLGHIRFGDSGYWGGAQVFVEFAEAEAVNVWKAIFRFAAEHSMVAAEPCSRSFTFFDSSENWLETGSCDEDTTVMYRVGGRDPQVVALAREQLLDTIRAHCPDCRVAERN